MRVAEAVGLGKAKVTLSFPAWKEGKVAPATFEVPVVAEDPKTPASEKAPSPPEKVESVKPDGAK